MSSTTDPLAPLGRQVLKLDAAASYTRLVIDENSGNPAARALLDKVTAEQLVLPPIGNIDAARALLAGLWLWHDWLEPSHLISQSVDTPEGSFWHAILHRREGDFSNSKYWYAKVGRHPAFPTLAAQANGILNSMPADKMLLKLNFTGWNPAAMVDLVETVHAQPDDPRHQIAVSLQQLEWRVLFDHCLRAASGE